MKRKGKVLTALLLAAAMVTTGTGFTGSVALARENNGNEIYIAANGDDQSGDGTLERPYATFEKARDAAREQGEENPVVLVRGGTYFFRDALELNEQDSGITFQNYNGEAVELSGAIHYEQLDWTDYEGNSAIKVAEVDQNLGIDKLFLDKEEQVLARYPDAKPGVIPLEGATTRADIKSRVGNYQDPAGGYIRAIHSNGWGGNDYIITGKNTANALGLDYRWVGDNNRGNGMQDNAVVIENVFEELDSPKEWFYDNEGGKLYIYPEEGTDLNEVTVQAAVNTDIIRITGTDSGNPVSDITLDGFTYFGTKRTMFTVDEEGKEYIPLMRGDWCVVKAGAVYIENGQNIRVINSNFIRMGGNGIFMYGYNDRNIVDNNEFIDIGATAVQVIGDPAAAHEASFWEHALYPQHQVHKTTVDYPDQIGPATEDYPRDIEITNNHMENLGIFEKQSCGVNLSVSSRVKILHNTIHKSARSCINVNDGTFGGHEIAYNDVYNAQLETTDHGPFNSWGRDRFWSVPKYNASGESGDLIRNYQKGSETYDLALIDAYQTVKIHDNRFQHDSDAAHTWGIDLDDGSSNYEIYNNLCMGLGIKLREGFDRKVYNNIILDGQFQIHVSYKEAGDEIYGNIVANATPYGFASVDENRFKQAEYAVDKNWYFDFGAKINLPSWYHISKDGNDYDKNALIDVDPQFKNARANDYTVLNEEGMEQVGFENFPMDQFGKPGCECQAPLYAKVSSGPGGSDLLQREEWKGATVTGIDDNIISSTASTGYNGIYFEEVPEDSEAYALGYRQRDIVKVVNGTELGDKKSFFTELGKIAPNALVIPEIHRTNRMQTISYHKAEGNTEFLDCNDDAVTYSGEVSTDLHTQNGWYFDSRQSGDLDSTICAYADTDNTNTPWFEVAFSGNKIDYISRKYSDQGDVEMIITNTDTGEEVERKTISCTDGSRLYQQTVYSSPILPEGNYKLRGEKKSGTYLIVDAFKVYREEPDVLSVNADPIRMTYEGSTAVAEPIAGETFQAEIDFENNSKADITADVSYLLYDISSGLELIALQEDPFTIAGGESKAYNGTYTFPEDVSNKILQIIVTNSADEAIAYNTWVKPEGIELEAAPISPDTPEGSLGISYDRQTRRVDVTAAGVTANSQVILRARMGETELFVNQVKGVDQKAGFSFILPDSVETAAEVMFTVHSELGKSLEQSVTIDPGMNIVNKDTLKQAIAAAEEITADGYTRASWELFSEALKEARAGLDSEELTQEQADTLAQALNDAREALEKAEETIIIKGNDETIKRTGDWTVRANSESCDTTVKDSYAELSFSGKSVEWYGVTANDHGIAEVSVVDDEGNIVEGSQEQVDCYSQNRQSDVLLYRCEGLDPAETYKIIVKQNGKNQSSSSTYIEVYSFRVLQVKEEPVIRAESVELSEQTAQLAPGDTLQLSAEVKPEEAFNKNVFWTSQQPEVADVDQDGLVTAKAVGTAAIVVTTEDGEHSDTCQITVAPIAVTGISLDHEEVTLTESGETLLLTAEITPENATNQNVIWLSSDEDVATVEAGLVAAVSDGTTTITATTEDGDYTALCRITVTTETEVNVTGIEISHESTTLTAEGAQQQLAAVLSPENATNRNVSWSSSDESVVMVDAQGLITAVADGEAVVTATSEDGGFTDECYVTVQIGGEAVPVESVTLNQSQVTLTGVGQSTQLTALVGPEEAANKNVIWSSSDETVAAVDQTGFVTAVAKGTAVISVETEEGGFIAECEVQVGGTAEVTAITLDTEELRFDTAGAAYKLVATVLPEEAVTDIKWMSLDESVASVADDGTVTARANGTTTILAVTKKGGYTAVCRVLVEIPPEIPKEAPVVKAGIGTTGTVKASWDAVSGAASYNVYIYNAKTKKRTVKTTDVPSVTLTGLPSGVRFSIQAAAVNEAGEGAKSKLVSTVTTPKKMTLKPVRKVSSSKVKLTYKKVDCSGYEIYMRSSNTQYKRVATTRKTTYTKTKLRRGIRYYFKVRAYKNLGSQKVYGKFSGSKSIRIR